VVNKERTGVRGAPITVPPLPGGRVLLAEDNEVNRGVFRRMIELLEIECDTAADGESAARAALGERPYDVILMDVQMPGVDGLEATRRIRAAGVSTPVLALTATALHGDRERCLAAGMNGHLQKPITLPELRRALAAQLQPQPAVPARSAPAAPAPAAPAPGAPVPAGPTPAGPTPPLAEPGINLDKLRCLEEELADRPLVLATVSTFLAELAGRRAALADALGREDRDALRAMAHTLKSSSALLGAEVLAAACAAVEQHSAAGPQPELGTLVAAVDRASTATESAMTAYLAEANQPGPDGAPPSRSTL
jgi:CheY-like chemotaxis protein